MLGKKRHKSKKIERENQNAWVTYVKQQRVTRRKCIGAKVKCKRNAVQFLKEKGMEGGRELYRFLRREEMPDHENVEHVRVNGEYVTDEERIRESIGIFSEDVGSLGEAVDVKDGCDPRLEGWV